MGKIHKKQQNWGEKQKNVGQFFLEVIQLSIRKVGGFFEKKYDLQEMGNNCIFI